MLYRVIIFVLVDSSQSPPTLLSPSNNNGVDSSAPSSLKISKSALGNDCTTSWVGEKHSSVNPKIPPLACEEFQQSPTLSPSENDIGSVLSVSEMASSNVALTCDTVATAGGKIVEMVKEELIDDKEMELTASGDNEHPNEHGPNEFSIYGVGNEEIMNNANILPSITFGKDNESTTAADSQVKDRKLIFGVAYEMIFAKIFFELTFQIKMLLFLFDKKKSMKK